MIIEIWSIGRGHDKGLQNLIEEYSSRVSKYAKLEWILFKNYVSDDKELVLKKEAEMLLSKITNDDFTVILDRQKGQSFDSEKFADQMMIFQNHNYKKNIFIIGGAFGLHDSLIKNAKLCINFSAFTFPHQIVRLILIEQIYRAFTILNNFPYHH